MGTVGPARGRFRRMGTVESGAGGGSNGWRRSSPARGAVPMDGDGRVRRRGRFQWMGTVESGAGGGSNGWGRSSPARGAVPMDGDGRVRRRGRFRRMRRSDPQDGSSEGQISDRFGCITTQSRAQKSRSGCSPAGGWGTSQSPETRPRLGRSPPVSQSCDVYRSVWAQCAETFLARGQEFTTAIPGAQTGARPSLAQAAPTADELPALAGASPTGSFRSAIHM
jgi:hypothetical protein